MPIVANDLDTYGLRSFKINKRRRQPVPHVIEEPLVGPPFTVAKTASINELPVVWDVTFEAYSDQDAKLFEQFLDYLDSGNGKFFKVMSTEWGPRRHEMQIVGNRPQPQHKNASMWVYSFSVYSKNLDRSAISDGGIIIA